MKIAAHGKSWLVPHPQRVNRSEARFLLGCGRCGTTCNSCDSCACCRSFKKRTAGGTPFYYPDDGNGHRQIMSMETFREIYRSEAA